MTNGFEVEDEKDILERMRKSLQTCDISITNDLVSLTVVADAYSSGLMPGSIEEAKRITHQFLRNCNCNKLRS